MINPRYFLLVIAAATLSSCETYKAMRQTPIQHVYPTDTVEETVTEAEDIAPLPQALKTLPKAPKKPYAIPRNSYKRGNSRDTGLFMRPDTLAIPTNDQLKETSTSTQRALSTPGLSVPN